MNIFFILIAIFLILYILNIVIKGNFDTVESIFWIFCNIIVLLLAIFPKILDNIALKLGIYYSPSLFFLLVAIFLLIITFRCEEKIFALKEKLNYLSQDLAILKEKVNKESNSSKE